jgi:hypothetical protein
MTVATQLEKGFVSSSRYLHAAERILDGLDAFCGAGKIIQLVPGRFDPKDRDACPSCAGYGGVAGDLGYRSRSAS